MKRIIAVGTLAIVGAVGFSSLASTDVVTPKEVLTTHTNAQTVPTSTLAPLQEDEAGWDCATMGNRICAWEVSATEMATCQADGTLWCHAVRDVDGAVRVYGSPLTDTWDVPLDSHEIVTEPSHDALPEIVSGNDDQSTHSDCGGMTC